MKLLLAITIALLPSAVLAEQFTPQQMLDVMTKSPSNRDVRVHDMLYDTSAPAYNSFLEGKLEGKGAWKGRQRGIKTKWGDLD